MTRTDPTIWNAQFSATQMAVTYPDHLTGAPQVHLFELHREAPEGVFTGKTLTVVTAKNGREFVIGMIPAERAEDIRWVTWPLAECDTEPTYTISHAVKIAGEWVRQYAYGVRESDVSARMDTLRWSGSTDLEYTLD